MLKSWRKCRGVVTALRSLAEFCNYEGSLSKVLRDRLVIGVQDPNIQRRLLAEKDLTFEKAFELVQSLERASESAMAIQSQAKGAAAQSEMVHKIKVNSHSSSKKPDNRDQSLPPCYRCGKGNHSPVACKFKTATCDGCGKVGHIRPACFSKNKSKQQRVARAGNVRHVREKENEEEAYDLNLIY